MKLTYDHQERIRLIMSQIESELATARSSLPKPSTQIVNRKPATVASPPVKVNSNASKPQNEQSQSDKDVELGNAYRTRAIKAYKQNKIFTVHGNYGTIRRALLRRGWLEKLPPNRLQKLQQLSFMRLVRASRKGNDYEVATISKILQPYHANFVWQPKYFKDVYSSVNPLRNRVRRSRCLDFSTKIGLIGCFENSHWNTIENIAETVYLPSYTLSNKDEEQYFLQEFRTTLCIGVLVYLLESEKPNQFFEPNGILPMSFLEFAIDEVERYCQQQDSSESMESIRNEDDDGKWEVFSVNSQNFLYNNQKISATQFECVQLLKKTSDAVEKMIVFKPFLQTYGHRNLWILKPGFQCRGQGIIIMNNFSKILKHVAIRQKSCYIVQKYIEKPLLIYKTKFDIRQYMIVAIFDEISIWLYKDCYLRFSSREFTLKDWSEAIHLTNNSVQKKYKNAERDLRLPTNNMWSLSEFKTYLKKQQNGDTWDDEIYPSFKKMLVSIVLSSLEETELTKNSFELYGCDFMLDDRFNPFLIEINSTPDLSPSTSVTSKICPAAMEDLMKVVLDYTNNPKASTGKFELVHKVPYPSCCKNATELVAIGVTKKIHQPPTASRKTKLKRFLKKKILRNPTKSKKENKAQT